MNSTVHSAHGKSPFSVVYGFEPVLPLDHQGASECKVHAVAELVTSRRRIQDLVVTKLQTTNEAMAQ